MQTILLSALLLGGALAVVCAWLGVHVANLFGAVQRFHPSFVQRLLRRLVLGLMIVAVGSANAAVVTVVMQGIAFAAPPQSMLVGPAIWAAGVAAFGLGYRFARGRRMLKALDTGIAVGLH
jgi:hypothetical protein